MSLVGAYACVEFFFSVLISVTCMLMIANILRR